MKAPTYMYMYIHTVYMHVYRTTTKTQAPDTKNFGKTFFTTPSMLSWVQFPPVIIRFSFALDYVAALLCETCTCTQLSHCVANIYTVLYMYMYMYLPAQYKVS